MSKLSSEEAIARWKKTKVDLKAKCEKHGREIGSYNSKYELACFIMELLDELAVWEKK
jgi:hypothetical protein|tara:strand:+ start:1564 stop:1737 length:174 start_codon:yes stop_codon:yes gene_type:complete